MAAGRIKQPRAREVAIMCVSGEVKDQIDDMCFGQNHAVGFARRALPILVRLFRVADGVVQRELHGGYLMVIGA
jgi:hypothetical protein